MKITVLPQGWFLRLDPGDEFIESLTLFAQSYGVSFAAILSGVGMVAQARMGFFCVSKGEYDTFKLTSGPYDLSSISGNLSEFDGQAWPHLHIVMNRMGGETYSGHVLSAICHITAEMFIADHSRAPVRRRTNPDLPASRLDDDSIPRGTHEGGF